MNISVYGTAFTSYDVKATTQTKEEIEKENVSFQETIKKTNEIEEISYHTTIKDENYIPTIFKDPTNGKYVVASLEQETIDKLSSHFGSDDIIPKKDGTLRLIGDVEAFVSGWFADIAYKREFLQADANNDGVINEEEYNNTRNNFGVTVMALTESSSGEEILIGAGEKIIDGQTYGYSNFNNNEDTYRNYHEFHEIRSLDAELNDTLQVDSDFNGEMSLEEAYNADGEGAEHVVLRDVELFWDVTIPEETLTTNDFDFLLNFIFDIFLQKTENEQEKLMTQLHNMLNSLEDTSQENIEKNVEQIYTQERLEHIHKLKQSDNPNDTKVEKYV